MATILTAAQVAEKFETDARTVRKFLRSITPKEDQPGKGKRWELTATDANRLKKRFKDWSNEQAERKAKVDEKPTEVEVADDSGSTTDEVEELEPTAEELEALENE